jgi:hypothetical protein
MTRLLKIEEEVTECPCMMFNCVHSDMDIWACIHPDIVKDEIHIPFRDKPKGWFPPNCPLKEIQKEKGEK